MAWVMENKRIKLIGLIGIFGFVLLFLFHLHMLQIMREGNQKLLRINNRNIVYQYLIKSLQNLESHFDKAIILSHPDNAQFYLRNLDRRIDQLHRTLTIIDRGGILTVRTPLNLPESDFLTREIFIPAGTIDKENLNDILGSYFLISREAKALRTLLMKRSPPETREQFAIKSLSEKRHNQLVLTKDLDANIRRMIENINRIYYYDQQHVTAEKRNFDQLTGRYRFIEYFR